MKIEILSDGTSAGTKVVNADTKEPIENIAKITWTITAPDIAQVRITFSDISIVASGELEQ